MVKIRRTLLMTAAVACLSTGAFAENYGADSTRGAESGYDGGMNDTDMDNRMGVDSRDGVESRMDSQARSDVGTDTDTQMDTDMRMGAGTYTTQGMQDASPSQLSSAEIQDVQQSLNDEGYSLSVDGVWGPQTRDAIRNFQQANNLDVTGTLDSQTLAELDVDVNRNTMGTNY